MAGAESKSASCCRDWAGCVDDIACCAPCHTDNPNHGPALFLMNNGSITPTRPSMGAWLSYGLGTENADLPAYVVLCPGRPVRFAELWSSGFLPGEHQGRISITPISNRPG